jgi:flavodoxin I
MTEIIIVYASMTGNTEEIAEAIADGVREAGIEPVVKSVLDASASELSRYDGILLGAYTWGDGELPDEFLDFYEEMDEIEISGLKSAVFGSADSSYVKFGAAVDILEEKLAQLGSQTVLPGLKIELRPSAEEKQACKEFGRKFADMVRGNT